jgi:hypothetical protein
VFTPHPVSRRGSPQKTENTVVARAGSKPGHASLKDGIQARRISYRIIENSEGNPRLYLFGKFTYTMNSIPVRNRLCCTAEAVRPALAGRTSYGPMEA